MGLHQATSGSIYMNGQHIDPYVDRKAVHPVMQMVFKILMHPLIHDLRLMRF